MEQLESIKMAYGDNSWTKLQLVIKVSSVRLLSQILKLVCIKTKKRFFSFFLIGVTGAVDCTRLQTVGTDSADWLPSVHHQDGHPT